MPERLPRKRTFCGALPGHFMIGQDGATTGCICGKLMAGNINEQGFDDILLDPARLSVFKALEQERFSLIPACAECRLWLGQEYYPNSIIRIRNRNYTLRPFANGVYIDNNVTRQGKPIPGSKTLDSPDWLFPLTLPNRRPLYRLPKEK